MIHYSRKEEAPQRGKKEGSRMGGGGVGSQPPPEFFLSVAQFGWIFLRFPFETSKPLIFYLDFTKKGNLDFVSKASNI